MKTLYKGNTHFITFVWPPNRPVLHAPDRSIRLPDRPRSLKNLGPVRFFVNLSKLNTLSYSVEEVRSNIIEADTPGCLRSLQILLFHFHYKNTVYSEEKVTAVSGQD